MTWRKPPGGSARKPNVENHPFQITLGLLKEDLVQILRNSQCVKHAQYGIGFVTESNAERTSIEFNDHGKKKFVTSIMVVELLVGEAPAKPASKRRKKAAARATTGSSR